MSRRTSAAARKPVPEPRKKTRLPAAYIEQFLEEHGITTRQLEDGAEVWPARACGRSGCPARRASAGAAKTPLTFEEIEWLISIEDKVAWAYLNLIVRKAVRGDDGEIVIRAGTPWILQEVQARKLARVEGDTIFECGSKIGKTSDIVLQVLHGIDTATGNAEILIASFSDAPLKDISTEIEYQLEQNPLIGSGVVYDYDGSGNARMRARIGVVDGQVKPYREKVFGNGNRYQMRLCGHEGAQFRGAHPTLMVLADEAAIWKHSKQWSELWRAGGAGVQFRIYSTPDGDYSSPFCRMCARAIPLDGSNGTDAVETSSEEASEALEDAPKFQIVNIAKWELKYPFWSDRLHARLREKYGGEHSPEWMQNVEGKWGTPSDSVFPMPVLNPCLKGGEGLRHYRIVTAVIDREKHQVLFHAARLMPEGDGAGELEVVMAREVFNLTRDAATGYYDAKQLAAAIASYFPSNTVADWKSPLLYCGGDLGSSQDPTELLFVRVLEKRWIDVFRLRLENADWPVQGPIVCALDHASGHQVRYGFDNGSAGNALVSYLTSLNEYRECPGGCPEPVYFHERLDGFGFGNAVDVIDIETGQPIVNPNNRDEKGNARPHRVNNKEFSTQAIERKLQGVNLDIANDGGAGDPNIASAQLLVNHTWRSKNERGERTFRDKDDHTIDARRQAAIAILEHLVRRGKRLISASPDVVASAGLRDSVASDFAVGAAHVGFESTIHDEYGGGDGVRSAFAGPFGGV
ncbi:MAG: hypothetical protein M3547_00205 [Acidobacteriota bacterium]|nr:hypothetical protein [Acidobacteriota bacterium]